MRLFTLLLIFSPCWLFCQEMNTAFPELLPVTDDVTEIRQRNFNHGFWPNGWKSLYRYKGGKLIRQTNYFRGELRMDETFEYTESINQVKIKSTYTDKKNYSLTVNQYNERGRLIKSELFLDQDTINPYWLCHKFQYDTLREVVKFERISFYPNDRQSIDCHELRYSKGRLMEKLTYDSCISVSQRDYIAFRNSRKAFRVVDFMNPDVIVTGGRSEKGIQRYLYKLDKRDNWFKRYYVRSNGRKILEIKRKIKYVKQSGAESI